MLEVKPNLFGREGALALPMSRETAPRPKRREARWRRTHCDLWLASYDFGAGVVNWQEPSQSRKAESLSCAKYVRGIEVVDRERLMEAVQAEFTKVYC